MKRNIQEWRGQQVDTAQNFERNRKKTISKKITPKSQHQTKEKG